MCYNECIRRSFSAENKESMPTPKGEFLKTILEFLSDAVQLLPMPLESPYAHAKRLHKLTYKEYYDALYRLHKRGIVKIEKEQGKNFIKLTQKGVLEHLLDHSGMEVQEKWDRKWRMLLFDIPEKAHLQRDRLRWILKKHGFYKFQASVFIHPYPMNRKTIEYLQSSGLSEYIRVVKVDEMDFDSDLKKKFNLK